MRCSRDKASCWAEPVVSAKALFEEKCEVRVRTLLRESFQAFARVRRALSRTASLWQGRDGRQFTQRIEA